MPIYLPLIFLRFLIRNKDKILESYFFTRIGLDLNIAADIIPHEAVRLVRRFCNNQCDHTTLAVDHHFDAIAADGLVARHPVSLDAPSCEPRIFDARDSAEQKPFGEYCKVPTLIAETTMIADGRNYLPQLLQGFWLLLSNQLSPIWFWNWNCCALLPNMWNVWLLCLVAKRVKTYDLIPMMQSKAWTTSLGRC